MFEPGFDQAAGLRSDAQRAMPGPSLMPLASPALPSRAFEWLCQLAVDLADAGHPVVVIDATATERAGLPDGLLGALNDASVAHLGPACARGDWLVMPGRRGLQALQATARAAAAPVASPAPATQTQDDPGYRKLNRDAPLRAEQPADPPAGAPATFLCREAILGRNQRIAGYQFMLQEGARARIRHSTRRVHHLYAEVLVRSLASMQRDLREMIELITGKARGVSAISQRLSSGCHSVAISSQQQSDGANTMAAAANQMNASIEEITRHAEQARQMANQAEHLAKDGGQVIHQVVKDMDAIAHSVQASAQVIRTLDQESEQIFGIIQVIKGIADQTNLLALNAAIEAARAGEQGRGFAVVADEVRQLAGRTSASTEEIASMVQRIQSSTREAVTSMEAGVTQVDKGMTVTADVERAIREILEATLSTTRLVDDISRTIGEQSLASHEIAQQVDNIANMSRDNSKVIEQTAQTTDELARLADELGHSVDRFRLS